MQKTNRRSKQSTSSNEKQQYEERIRELERQNKAYEMEIEELRQHANDSSAPNHGLEKLKEDYLQKLNALELQAAELKKKLNSQSQFSTQRKRGDDATKQSQFEIQFLKAQKVQLQCKMKLESVQFRSCKASLEKEVLQLKKEKRKNDYEVQKLLASNLRLKMVLQRKTEEASVATKRLREMIESRKAISSRTAGAMKVNPSQATEHELDVTTHLHELCSQYESQIEEMAEEITKLKEEAEMQRQEKLRPPLQHEDCDSLKQDLDIKDLKEQVNGLDFLLRQLRLQKKLNHRNEMQNLVRPLFSDGNHDKLDEQMKTPEMNLSSETEAKMDESDGLCCSCSKKSLCKTNKCRCRSAGGSCGTSCGCTRFKCTNRELNPMAADEPPKSGNTENVKTASASAIQVHNGNMIASEGAKLLESALLEKPAAVRDNLRRKKKPLCDIQNSRDDLNAKIPDKKKNGKKPTIQLVTEDPYSLPESINHTDED
ncbi:kinesin-like protein KIN-4C isoform X2 [Prosopis cineraria]|uniref:kinesin-like protein KIN-4C isoform X2 n=1 Tax=Prosopis cineraria TaxID=364024 RepID=UPI0024101C12|nr:kinesin-like protein KIN-4C isoform X2 [Prosopis cineraria]